MYNPLQARPQTRRRTFDAILIGAIGVAALIFGVVTAEAPNPKPAPITTTSLTYSWAQGGGTIKTSPTTPTLVYTWGPTVEGK
jgi:hypothetical protein